MLAEPLEGNQSDTIRFGPQFPGMPVYFKVLCILKNKTKPAHWGIFLCSKQSASVEGFSAVASIFKQIFQM